MCLVVPLQVKELKTQKGKPAFAKSYGEARMEDGRIVKSLVKNIKVGDYLICQQDLAIEKVSKNKAQLIRNALRQGI